MSNNASTYQDYSTLVANLKASFPRHKTYSLRRGERRDAVQQLAQAHGLAENTSKGGWVQCTPSIHFGWSVYEQGDKVVFLYRDGGMGWDTVMLMGKDRAGLETLRQTGLGLGLVKARKPG
jgi:hypothetical protein